MASSSTVTVALTHQPHSSPLSLLGSVIVKGTINVSFLFFPLLYPKVMAFSRVCHMQNCKEPARNTRWDISVNPHN